MYRYDPGGGRSTLAFLQKVPRLFDENDRMEDAVKMLKKMEPEIAVYHTRVMQKRFQKEIKLLNSLTPPHVVRHIYKVLAGDTSAEIAPQEIDEVATVATETEDLDHVTDLQNLNKG